MAYKRKTKDIWVIQTNYGTQWCDECYEETVQDGFRTYGEYIDNLARYGKCSVRLKKRRVRLEEAK